MCVPPEPPARATGARPGPDLIDLGAGHPAAELLPVGLFARSAAATLVPERASVLNYGSERGEAAFRRRLATFLERQTAEPAHHDRLLVTAGASQALDLLCTLLTVPGDAVVVTDPTYHLALRTFADHGLRVVTVPAGAHGRDSAALDAALARQRVRMVYVMPSFANPTGARLAEAQRRALLELAATADAPWVVADDVYALLAFDAVAAARFATGAARAVALGSFSKILAPGLRLGWIEGPPELLARIESSGLVQSGGGLNPLPAALVSEVLEDGALAAHLIGLRAAYRERAAALHDALTAALPSARAAEPSGGYFVWAELAGVDTAELLSHARRLGVGYQPGARFSAVGSFAEHVRLSFSRYGPDVLRMAAGRLAQAVESNPSR